MVQDKILSIRLSPGGLSFWTTGIVSFDPNNESLKRDIWSMTGEKETILDPQKNVREELASKLRAILAANTRVGVVEVYVDTLRTLLFPSEYSSGSSISRLLEINNIVVEDSDEVLYVDIDNTTRAVMIYPGKDLETLRSEVGTPHISILSPFAINNIHIEKYGPGRKRSAAIYITPQNAYISVFESKSGILLYADIMKWTAAADLLYYLSVLDEEFGFRKGKVYLRGRRAEEAGKLLRKYFRKTRCE